MFNPKSQGSLDFIQRLLSSDPSGLESSVVPARIQVFGFSIQGPMVTLTFTLIFLTSEHQRRSKLNFTGYFWTTTEISFWRHGPDGSGCLVLRSKMTCSPLGFVGKFSVIESKWCKSTNQGLNSYSVMTRFLDREGHLIGSNFEKGSYLWIWIHWSSYGCHEKVSSWFRIPFELHFV